MKWPPYLMQLKVHSPKHVFSIWLPLFIIGPIVLIFVLVLFLIALPFLLLSLMFTWEFDYWQYIKKAPLFVNLLFSLRGLQVDVEDREQHFVIAFY